MSAQQQSTYQQRPSLPRRKRSSTVSEETPTLSLNAARKRAMLVAMRGSGAGTTDNTLGNEIGAGAVVSGAVRPAPTASRTAPPGAFIPLFPQSSGMVRHNSTPSTGAEPRAHHA